MAEQQPAVLRAEGLCWAVGERYVLLDAAVSVQPASLSVVWGDNGAGKSTLLELLAGLRTPSRGRVHLHGVPLDAVHPAELARRVARVGHLPGTLLDLTAFENVALAAALAGQDGNAASVRAALNEAGLGTVDHHRPVRGFSRGMLQRTAIARLLVSGAEVWLLDEPATGLDAQGTAALAVVLDRARRRGVAVVLTTHDYAWLPAVDQWLQVHRGAVREVQP